MLSAKTQRGQISNSRARSVEKKCRSSVRPLTGALLRVPLTTGARGAIRRPRRLGCRPPRPGVRCGRCERGGGGRGKRRAGPGGRRAAFADTAASRLARATGATAARARWETLAASTRRWAWRWSHCLADQIYRFRRGWLQGWHAPLASPTNKLQLCSSFTGRSAACHRATVGLVEGRVNMDT